MVAGEGMILSGKAAEGKHVHRENAFQLHYFPEIPLHPTENRRVVSSDAAHQPGQRFVRDGGRSSAPLSGSRLEAPDGSQPHGPSEKTLEDIETEAYIRGFNKGERAGIDAAAEKIESLHAMLAGAIEQLDRVQKQIRQDSEKEVVELALAVSERIVRQELATKRETIVDVVREALKKVDHQQAVVIRLNPADMPFIDASRLQVSDPAGQANSIRVRLEADETIGSGGCFIETESGDVDARIETQLDIIKAAFREKLG